MSYLTDISEVVFLVKHLPGQHDQATHARRFKIPGDETSKVVSGPKIKKPKVPKTVKPKENNYNPFEPSKNPPPLDFIKTPDSVLTKFQNDMKEQYKQMSEAWGMSVEGYAKALDEHAQNLMKDAVPFIKIRGTALEKVLKEGRFKTQFETNKTSSKLLNPSLRAEEEQKLFGYEKDLAPEKRPIYGYFADNPQGKSTSMLSGYGDISVRMKSHVKENSTITMGDSLDEVGSLIPKPANHVDRMAFSLMKNTMASPLTSKKLEDISFYPEAQYHNGLNM